MSDEEASRVLVIDDDPVYRELLTIALTGEGYRVLLAENGQNGKEILQGETVDVIIVDMETKQITAPRRRGMPDSVTIIRDDNVYEFTRDLGINVNGRGEA